MPDRLPRTYRAFGLILQSTLDLPELREVDDDGNGDAASREPDVRIAIGPAPPPDEAATRAATWIEAGVCAGPDRFWIEVAGTVRIDVRDGTTIVIDPAPGAAAGDVRAFVLGSAIGALLHQRGWLPLHASAVAIGGRAVAFVGASGQGKSTLAMQLDRRGARVICDDVCAIDMAGPVPRLWPGLRHLKLWRTSLQAIGETPGRLEPVLGDLDKYRFPIAAPADYRGYEPAAIVELAWGDATALARRPAGAAAAMTLVANTFRGQLVAPMRRQRLHLRQCIDLSSRTDMYRLTRERSFADSDAISSLIEGCL